MFLTNVISTLPKILLMDGPFPSRARNVNRKEKKKHEITNSFQYQ